MRRAFPPVRRPALLAALPLLIGAAAPAPPSALVIRDARVFDGTGSPAHVASVLIRDGRIAQVAARIAAPRGAKVIDARGLTLLPGLHDLHTHLRSPGFEAPDDPGKAYAAYLADGITTVDDFSVYGEMLAPIRRMTGDGTVPAPHLQLAVRLSTTGGHGTEFGWGDSFTQQVDTPRAAHAAMARLLPYRPDVIKVFTDGWRYGRVPSLTSMNEPTLAAIVEDAHRAGLPVITHTVTLEGAKIAARAGVDALGHGVGDQPVDAELIGLMRAKGTAYIPTLAVYEPQETRQWTAGEQALLTPSERLAEQASGDARRGTEDATTPPMEARRWQIMMDNVRTLAAAAIPIGIGTDAGIEGVYHGASTLREIHLLAALGLPAAQVLASATGVSARILGQDGRHGRIAPGQVADLLLVAGRPDERIDDLTRLRRLFLAGREVNLPALRRLIDAPAMSPLPARPMTGPIDDGRSADGRTTLGTLLVDSYESGIDHSDLDFVRLPASPAQRPLFLVARLGPAPHPFARLTVPLTPGGVELADATGFAGVAFTVRGAGRYRMLVDSYGIDQQDWFSGRFDADDGPHEVRLPFAALTSAGAGATFDPARLRALLFELAGPPGGRAWLELSDLHFYRPDPMRVAGRS